MLTNYSTMTPSDIIPHHDHQSHRDRLISLALNGVESPNSKRNYAAALNEFLDWHESNGRPPLIKATVNEYKQSLHDRGLAASTINVKLSAIRKLVSEAADNGLIDQSHANGIKAVKGAKAEGVRAGNWLTDGQAQALLDAPDASTKKGLRDRAILAVMLGCALRRQEVANLTIEDIQQREGRWVIPDMIGKRRKVRTVPMPAWVKVAIDDWTAAAGITTGNLWRGFRKGDHIIHEPPRMSTQAIWRVVQGYASALGFGDIAPHDLRRTAAKLMHKAGVPLDQISIILGHGNVAVTERYLGVELDLQHAGTDAIPLKISSRPQRLPEAD